MVQGFLYPIVNIFFLFYGFYASSQSNLLPESATIELLASGRKTIHSSLPVSVFIVSNMLFSMPQKIGLLIILYIYQYNDFLKIFLGSLWGSKIL